MSMYCKACLYKQLLQALGIACASSTKKNQDHGQLQSRGICCTATYRPKTSTDLTTVGFELYALDVVCICIHHLICRGN